jgi:hypothetical protein
MMPDVIELDELKTGQRREGIFYGFMVLLQKFGLALGLFLVGQSLEWAGFVATVPGQPAPTQPASALLSNPYRHRSSAHNCFNYRDDSHLLLSHHPRSSC